MELRHLRYFVVVAEEQNVTRAAARLHVSQPPLSRQIRDLEEELGVPLFRRTAKSVALTEAGKLFLTEAREVLLRAEKAVQAVRLVAAGNRGQLRVGYAPSLSVNILPRTLSTFEHEHPGVRVSLHDLSTEEGLQRLTARKIDALLTARPPATLLRGLNFTPLAEFPLFIAISTAHPLARKKVIRVEALRDERFIVYTEEDYPEYLDWLKELFSPFGFSPRSTEEYDSATGVIAAVEVGRGIAIVTGSMQHLAGPRLKLLPLQPRLPALPFGAITRPNAEPLIQSFVSVAKQAARSTKVR